ncbi:hypothetical protein WJX74_011035 [Apatococcus lobatus]|uniref:Uncharacterized protein n=1 Tax=Apatococcus lobatus TaxID=904363 RepID=A0AAW1QKI1_9CHLO
MHHLSLRTVPTASLTIGSQSKALPRSPAGRTLQTTADKQVFLGSPPRHSQRAWSSGGRPSPVHCKTYKGDELFRDSDGNWKWQLEESIWFSSIWAPILIYLLLTV